MTWSTTKYEQDKFIDLIGKQRIASRKKQNCSQMKSGKLLEENTSSPITPNVTLPKEKLLKNPNENISWTPYLNSLPLTTENGVNLVDALIEQPQ